MEFNTFEYACSQKAEGKWALYKLLLILLYVCYVVAFGVIIYITAFVPVGALIPVTLWILVYFTYKYTSPDYKYTVEHGEMCFYKTVGKKEKKITSFPLKDALLIAPINEAKDKISELGCSKSYSAVPYAKCPDVYAALYTDREGKRCVFYFRATREALKVMNHYNKEAIKVIETAL